MSHVEVDQVVPSSHHQSKRMITVFLNGIGKYMLNILPENAAIDDPDFAQGLMCGLEASCYAEGRILYQRRVTMHFGNASSTL
jgi:hypothetical protein